MEKRILAVSIVGLILLAALLWSQRTEERLRVSGFIEADEIRVGSRVGGRVKRVAAVEGQTVHTGELLLEFEPFDLLQRRAEAAAVLAQRIAQYEKLTAGFRPEEIAEAKARVDQSRAYLEKLINGPREQELAAARAEQALAQAELDRNRLQYQRVEALFARGAATQEEIDRAEAELKQARANVQVQTEHLKLLQAGTRAEELAEARASVDQVEQQWTLRRSGYRQEDVAEAEAGVEAGRAALDALDEQIAELMIKAPVDGVIEAVDLQPGDLVAANAPAIAMIDLSELWVRAYVPEDALNLQLGQEVDVTVDSFPNRTFSGRISFIATQAEFTPGNVQTPEERSKQVFRIKVVLTEGLDVLRPGMAADVWLE